VSVAVAEAGHRNISEILGATHMNPLYNFTSAPVLEEGSDVLRHMGSRTIKLWYGPDYKTNYPQNHSWSTVNNLTELALTSYFQTMFGDPDFKTYSLEMATFNYRTAWKNGLVGYESNSISAEVYAFASHLLDTYNNSGKTFILQNWEGDNNLGENASAVKVQGMIDWLNCWQDAITSARHDSTSSNVWVYGAAECNKVGQPNWEGPRCITDVFPYLHMDLYSYSDWYTRYEEDLLLEDLNNIRRYAPDSSTFGHDNVMLGEFGLNRNAVDGEAGNLLSSRTEFEIGMDVGARFALYWCVYDTNTNKSHGLVLNEEHADEFGLPVDHTGRYFTQTHNYFKTNSLTLDVFEDLANGFGECTAYSNMSITNSVEDELDNDPSRFVRLDKNQPGVLEYSFDRDVRRLAIMGYEEPGRVTTVSVSASKTGAAGSYIDIPLRKIINDVYPGNTYRRMLFKNTDQIPDGFRHFKLSCDSNVQWSPQIAAVRFYYERPADVDTIQFGGKSAHLSDPNHQAQVGADELVQFNGADSWGGAAGLNGSLNNIGIGAFVTSPSTGLRLTTTLISSTDAAGTNTVINASTGVIGIKGGDNAKFDTSNTEQWAFEFNQPVVLRQLLFAAINNDTEEVTVTVNGLATAFTRTDSNATASGWNVNRFIYTFDPPLQLSAGTDVQVEATVGQWGLEGVVVGAGALASAYDLWANMQGLEGTDADWFADPDGNGLDNQSDYALNGMVPIWGMENTGDSNVVEYVFQRRRDAAARGLAYNVEWTDNLVSNVWSSAGVAESGNEVIDAGFEAVTNRIPADLPQKFIHLEIEMTE
jgi:hypothetical protein